MTEPFELSIRAIGPGTDGGRLPLAEVARLAEGLQGTMERLALSISGREQALGRRPVDVVEAVRLDVVGFGKGSVVLRVRRDGQLALLDGLLEAAYAALIDGVHSLRTNPGAVPAGFTTQIIEGLSSLVGGIGTSITAIEFRRGESTDFVLNAGLRSSLREARRHTTSEEVSLAGRLHMADFAPAALRCRIDTYAGSVPCDFDEDLRSSVLENMDELVLVRGLAELRPDNRTITVLRLEDIKGIPGVQGKGLDEFVLMVAEVRAEYLSDGRADAWEDPGR